MEINLLPARIAPIEVAPRVWLLPSIGVAYVLSLAAIGQLHSGNIFLGALGFLDVSKTRQFLRTFLPCIVTGAIYDTFRFSLPPLIAGHIHVAGPYVLDRTLFGVGGSTLNEVFARHHWGVADVVAGFTYLAYVVEYLGLAMLLFFRRDTARAQTFARGFFVVSMLGFITYVVYPAAPPWYVAAHGLGPAQVAAVPSAAAAMRFDALLGTHVFANAYGHSVEVFGALPSLHVAYPALAVLLVDRTPALRWARGITVAYSLLMCFSAIYLQHHYVIDVLLGVIYAVITARIVMALERAALASPSHRRAARRRLRPSTTSSDPS